MIANRKKKYCEKEVEKLKEESSYQKTYVTLPVPSALKPAKGRDVEKLALDLCSFFSSISQKFLPLDREKIPFTFDRVQLPLTEQQVAE